MNYSRIALQLNEPPERPGYGDAVRTLLDRMSYAELRDECDTYRLQNKRRGWRSGTFSQWLRDRLTDRVIARDEAMVRDNWYGVME